MALQTFFNQIDKLRRDPLLSSIAPQMIQAVNQEPPASIGYAPVSPAPFQPPAPASVVNDNPVANSGFGSIAPQTTDTGAPLDYAQAREMQNRANYDASIAPMPVQSSLANVEAPAFPTGEGIRAMSQTSDPNLPVTQIQPEMQQNPAPTDSAPVASPLTGIAPQSVQTAQKIQTIKDKNYSKGVYMRPDGTQTSDKDTDGVPNAVIKAPGADRKKEWSTGDKIRNGVIGALIGFAQGGIGGAAAGAAMAGSNRNYQAQQSDRKILGQLQPQMAQEQQNEQFNMSQMGKAAVIKNTFDDNQRQAEQFRETTELKRQKFEQESSAKARNDFYRTNPYFDWEKATPAQKAQIAAFGQTPEGVGKYDFRNPLIKEVGGTSYKYNNSTGAFEETNLPKNGSKELVDFEVQMPGEPKPRIFKVSQDRAASFTTQMRTAGINADLAEKRLNYQAQNDEANRAQRRDEFVKNMSYKIEQDAKKGTLDKIKLLKDLQSDFAAGDLDQETFNQLKGTLEKF